MTRIPRALHALACLIVDGMSLMGGHNQLSVVCDQFCANASVPAVFEPRYLELKREAFCDCVRLQICPMWAVLNFLANVIKMFLGLCSSRVSLSSCP